MSKTLIFSDTHLGSKFNQKKFQYLQRLFAHFDHIIINGDFWDDSKISFEKFLNSEWSELFPLLKEKNAVYIFGNHDPKHRMDERIYLFCDKACYAHTVELPDGKVLQIEHGQNSSFLSRLTFKIFKNHPKVFVFLASPIGYFQIFFMYLSKKGFSFYSRFINRHYVKISKKLDGYFITGHSHGIMFDEKSGYINSGFIDKNFASYVEVDGSTIFHVKNYY